MNFNEEIENELKDLNLGGKLIVLKQEDKGTPKDWLALEKIIKYELYKNDNMIIQSKLLATNSIL